MEPELRKVKVYRGMSEETEAFTAQLWVDGNYIADLKNDGHGGANRITHRFDERTDGDGLNTRPQVKAFEDWCREQLDPTEPVKDAVYMTPDYYISRMLDDHMEEQKVKRWCKTKTVVKLASHKDGEFATYTRPYTPEFAERIRAQDPTIVEILNERYLNTK